MIIRRRTYRKRKKDFSYGYFMVTNPGGYIARCFTDNNVQHNIYTSCYLLETPVGYFPNSLATLYTRPDGARSFVVGDTDGDVIIVWTIGALYKSDNGGISWTTVCTFTQKNWKEGPVAFYKDGIAYLGGAIQENGYRSLVIYKCVVSSRTLTTTTLINLAVSTPYSTDDSSYQSFNVDSGSALQTRIASTNNISPNGLFFVWDFSSRTGSLYYDNRYKSYILVDFINLKYSATWHHYTELSYYAVTGELGYWINDNSTYGYMIKFTPDLYLENPMWLTVRVDKIVNTPITYNGQSLNTTNITSTFNSKFATLINQVKNSGVIICHWALTARRNVYNNILFFTLGLVGLTFFTTDMNFNNLLMMDKTLSDLDTTVSGLSYYPDVVHITPDGKYGIAWLLNLTVMYDLSTHKYKESFKFKDLEGYDTEAPLEGGYLNIGTILPKKSL